MNASVISVPVISAMVAAVLIVLQQALMITVGLHRAQAGIGIGVGEDAHLERKVRRHGNLAENSALFVVTLAISELFGAPTIAVAGFGLAFVVARFSHAIGFSSLAGSHVGAQGSKAFVIMRAMGAFGTFFTGIGLGLFLAFTLATT